MNKAQSIQRSKLISSYGGVGSIIDTIDNLAFIIKPFDQWNLYTQYVRFYRNFPHLKLDDERLKVRLHNIGFSSLEHFFLPDDSFENVRLYHLDETQKNRMVTAEYAPQWFYCEKCGRLKHIEKWKIDWGQDMGEPRCAHCRTGKDKYRAPRLQQVRFMLASLENGELKDLPWDLLWSVKNGSHNFKGKHDEIRSVWDLRNERESKEVSFHTRKGGSDLIDIYVKYNNGITLTMAEIMNHYIILDDNHAYQPVIRSANNVYFSYTISSVYIPRHIITPREVDDVKKASNDLNADKIHEYVTPQLSMRDIQYIIDNGVAPNPDYRSEELFRLDEYDYLTNHNNYINGQFNPDNRLDAWGHQWSTTKPPFIKDIFLLKHLEVTSVQVAYSRLERVSSPNYAEMKGTAKKQWFDINRGAIINSDHDIEVGLHPTCSGDRGRIKYMPAVISRGEGVFVELDLSRINDNDSKKVFTHTFAHLVMKELEFSCGYPLPSMNERLYILPAEEREHPDKYGFILYSANGEAGSYGGISTLFENKDIEKILNNAIELADDCPNDPICESEGASCFACVQIPEIACEMFNKDLSRTVFKDECKKHYSLFSDLETSSNNISSQDSNQTSDLIVSEGDKEICKTTTDKSIKKDEIIPGVVLG